MVGSSASADALNDKIKPNNAAADKIFMERSPITD
jgi:hypothetical protein